MTVRAIPLLELWGHLILIRSLLLPEPHLHTLKLIHTVAQVNTVYNMGSDLVAYNVTPVYVRPGQTFRVGYQINSSFYDDIPVGLGCSIKSPSGREYSDINHDTSVSVSYGTD